MRGAAALNEEFVDKCLLFSALTQQHRVICFFTIHCTHITKRLSRHVDIDIPSFDPNALPKVYLLIYLIRASNYRQSSRNVIFRDASDIQGSLLWRRHCLSVCVLLTYNLFNNSIAASPFVFNTSYKTCVSITPGGQGIPR